MQTLSNPTLQEKIDRIRPADRPILTIRHDAFKEFKYDPRSQRYRVVEGAGTGRFISKSAFLRQTTEYIDRQSVELVALGDRLSNGSINLRQFQQQAAERLKEIHVSQAIVAANGVENLTVEDYLQVGRNLKQQYYSGKDGDKRFGIKHLTQDILDGNVSPAQLSQRLALFAQSGKQTYWQIKATKSGKPFAIRQLGNAEHCKECEQYAKEPPKAIASIVLPTQKCSCRMNCKCSLVFLSLEEAIELGMKAPRSDVTSSVKWNQQDLLNAKKLIEDLDGDSISAIQSIRHKAPYVIVRYRRGNDINEAFINPDATNPREQIYSDLIDEQTSDRADEWRLDADRFDEWKCKKGKPCKGRCIPKGNRCLDDDGLSDEDKAIATELRDKAIAVSGGEQSEAPQPTRPEQAFIDRGADEIGRDRLQALDNALKVDPSKLEELKTKSAEFDKELDKLWDEDPSGGKVFSSPLWKEATGIQAEIASIENAAKGEALNTMKSIREELLSSGMSKADAEGLANAVTIRKSATREVPEAELRETLTEFYQMTGGAGSDSLRQLSLKEERAWASENDGEVNIGRHSDRASFRETFFHEVGHHIEFEDREVMTAMGQWRDSRATGEVQQLSQFNSSGSYDADELARPGRYVNPYVGKVYDEGYTEVLSVGLEHFTTPERMLSFYQRDRDHFLLTVGAMRRRR